MIYSFCLVFREKTAQVKNYLKLSRFFFFCKKNCLTWKIILKNRTISLIFFLSRIETANAKLILPHIFFAYVSYSTPSLSALQEIVCAFENKFCQTKNFHKSILWIGYPVVGGSNESKARRSLFDDRLLKLNVQNRCLR